MEQRINIIKKPTITRRMLNAGMKSLPQRQEIKRYNEAKESYEKEKSNFLNNDFGMGEQESTNIFNEIEPQLKKARHQFGRFDWF